MTYFSVGILAIIIHLIINHDVLWSRDDEAVPAQEAYRHFLFGVLAYYITDSLWGIFDSLHLVLLLYIDTSVYFVAMSAAVFLWTRYVVMYLDDKGVFGKAVYYIGTFFFVGGIIAVVLNLVVPILFWFDEAGTYYAGPARYATLGVQVIMFMLTSIYTLAVMGKAQGTMRRRYHAIGFFGIAMTVLIIVQVFFPLQPLYSVGCMIGSCLLHTFVVEDEKNEYRRILEETLQRERQQEQELGSAKRLAYTDPLTGVKSMHAYIEAEAQVDHRIAQGEISEFGVVVFDLNGLKEVNDTQGHEAGDLYIQAAVKLICDMFKHSPIYRIGGDEFIAFLEGDDFRNRESLLSAFDRQIEKNLVKGHVVVATGMAEFDASSDGGYPALFDRADALMYERKRVLKAEEAALRE